MTAPTTHTRLLGCALAGAALATGCGGGGAPSDPFVIEVLAPDGSDTVNPDPIFLNAVDELELLFIPQDRTGQRFKDVSMRTFENGEVTSRVTTTGAYQMRFSRAWVTENATQMGPAFLVEIPVFTQGGEPEPEIADPTVRATVLRGDERIAETVPAPPVRWPLPEGEFRRFELECNSGFETQCQDMD